MKTLGIKLTHDGALAGFEDNRLMFCVEWEKLNNQNRYSKITPDNSHYIRPLLSSFNFEDVDTWVVDGWKGGKIAHWDDLPVASYHEFDSPEFKGLLDGKTFNSRHFDWMPSSYRSYSHVAGHVIGAYATSPWAKRREPSYVLTWDGGQNPRLHFVAPDDKENPVRFLGSIHELYGIIYGIMGYYFGPYKNDKPLAATCPLSDVQKFGFYGGYERPGKLMSWIAFGKTNHVLSEKLEEIYNSGCLPFADNPLGYNQDGKVEHAFMREVAQFVDAVKVYTNHSISDADVLKTIHEWLEFRLVTGVRKLTKPASHLCFAGGSALNIKWNSALRRGVPTNVRWSTIRHGCHFTDVWVPPFPNDSGSAIGAVACHLAKEHDRWDIDWSVYKGMHIRTGEVKKFESAGWSSEPCGLVTVANLLDRYPDYPILFLDGRGEIGPRALGNRSILMSARSEKARDHLNAIKQREPFRPVAPICIEQDAPEIFDPGTPDPYMLFDHRVRPEWRKRVPAIVHRDGTARLQTVTEEQNKNIFLLLQHYKKLTGIPLLCNTSANLNGAGFFPDVASAMRWGGVGHIYSNGYLYTHAGIEEGKFSK